MVFEHEGEYGSQWEAIGSIATKTVAAGSHISHRGAFTICLLLPWADSHSALFRAGSDGKSAVGEDTANHGLRQAHPLGKTRPEKV